MREDAELLEAWRDGDKEAGEALFHRHFELVKGFFAGKTTEAEELVQRTFERLLGARGKIRTSFRAYALTVARHELYASYRARLRGPGRFVPHESTLQGMLPTPSEVVAAKAEQRVLLEGLRRIPLDSQIVLELHYWDGLSTAELAEVLEAPRNTIKTRLRRARQLLEERLNELADGHELLQSTTYNFDRWVRSVRGQVFPDAESS